jgi:hypothetical protein
VFLAITQIEADAFRVGNSAGALALNPFDYLTELQRHAAEMEQDLREWMP